MPAQRITIHDLPSIDRPREKLVKYGPDRLSDTELIAIILRSGCPGKSALGLAEAALRAFLSGPDISRISLEQCRKVKGIGQAKACSILACLELGRRFFLDKKAGIAQLLSPQDVFDSLRDIRESKKEHFVIFFLDTRNQQIHREVISMGTVNASLVHPREVFEPAVKCLAVQVILAHNHPSGDTQPSEDDILVNKRLAAAGEILGIEVLDHIIVARQAFFSFKEHKLF
ncbi:MAG TPA: DNA repair protein RadC [Candidatus Omnitrophota bacterium]|nr:DNA repair protein RadC [Candidatus Omnitrophota bacterium]HRZ14424.1 DNA repair protein RadC [Candidatus Omnitrophota bacterium]